MKGKVYLVGAGPGDPGLITVKGLRYLQKAEVVVYDRLVDKRLLDKAPKEAQLVFVGKSPGQRGMEQEEINRTLVDNSLAGRTVVRLKGGDPFVFGRGGEEALALAKAGVPFEIVPGITSAIAAPAYAGIPLTHRQIASSFTVVSGNEDPSKDESNIRWDILARSGGTLVVLMGWGTLDDIAQILVKEGMAASTPVALVRWGTEPYQRTVTGTLEDIVQKGTEAGLSPPVVAIIGPVVELRNQIRWYDNKPLFGKRILVTRSRSQASVLSELLAQEGAEPVEIPTIEITPPDDWSCVDSAIKSLHTYNWVIFSSANGVESFFRRVEALGRDSRAFAKSKVGAIGPATAEALSRRGINADFVPTKYVAEAVVEGMEAQNVGGARVLLPRGDIGRDELPKGLTRLEAQVTEVTVYRSLAPQDSRDKAKGLLENDGVDLITFTSSSTVENLLNLLDGDRSLLGGAKVACIGPITAMTAQDVGLSVDIVAQEYTIPGLVHALKEHFAVLPPRVGGS